MTKNILKIIISVAVSLIAGYLAFRNVQLQDVIAGIRQVDSISVALVLLLIAGAQLLRSSRWGLMLEPLEPLSQRLLLPITSIGFLFVWILPARLGEVARPYLLQQNSKVSLSPAMGSVVLERLIDSTFLVVLLAICLPALRLPGLILSAFKGFVFILLAAVHFSAAWVTSSLPRTIISGSFQGSARILVGIFDSRCRHFLQRHASSDEHKKAFIHFGTYLSNLGCSTSCISGAFSIYGSALGIAGRNHCPGSYLSWDCPTCSTWFYRQLSLCLHCCYGSVRGG